MVLVLCLFKHTQTHKLVGQPSQSTRFSTLKLEQTMKHMTTSLCMQWCEVCGAVRLFEGITTIFLNMKLLINPKESANLMQFTCLSYSGK